MAKYEVVSGIDFPDRRVEAGEIVEDIDAEVEANPWLVEQDIVRLVVDAPVDESDVTVEAHEPDVTVEAHADASPSDPVPTTDQPSDLTKGL